MKKSFLPVAALIIIAGLFFVFFGPKVTPREESVLSAIQQTIPVSITYPTIASSFRQGGDITIKWSGATSTLPYGLILHLEDDKGYEPPSDSPALSKGMGPDLTMPGWNGVYTFRLSDNITPGKYRFIMEPAFYKGETLPSVSSEMFTVVSSSSPFISKADLFDGPKGLFVVLLGVHLTQGSYILAKNVQGDVIKLQSQPVIWDGTRIEADFPSTEPYGTYTLYVTNGQETTNGLDVSYEGPQG